ncbi:hypothetical protein BU17DRAFT_62135 [Hysterangium stoloniferum]|nr:hypothetical protein BU17DRAFT_62135 [Hysterangium stoloniferum]
MDSPVLLALLQLREANYSSAATLAAFAYDIILNFGREFLQVLLNIGWKVDYIWRSKWSLPKVLYIVVRYWGPIHVAINFRIDTHINPSKETGGSIIYTTLVNIILLLRLYSLYDRKAELYICIKSSLLAARNWFPAQPGVPFPGCLTTSASRQFTLGAWIPCLTVAVIFFLMTIWKLIETRKRRGEGGKESRHAPLSPLFIAFFRDGTVFFFVIAGIILSSLVLMKPPNIYGIVAVLAATLSVLLITGPLSNVEEPWLSFVYSLAGSRLIMNLREAASNKGGDNSWEETISLREIVFPKRINTCSKNCSTGDSEQLPSSTLPTVNSRNINKPFSGNQPL